MSVRGAGSISSPIIISDDDDNSIAQSPPRFDGSSDSFSAADLTRPSPSSVLQEGCSPQDSHVLSPSVAQSVGFSMALRMGFRPGHGLGFDLDGRLDPVSVTQKRRRADSGIGFQGDSEGSEFHPCPQTRKVTPKKPRQDLPLKVTQPRPIPSARPRFEGTITPVSPKPVTAAPPPPFRRSPTTISPLPTPSSHREQELPDTPAFTTGHPHLPLFPQQHHSHPVLPFPSLDLQDSWAQPWVAHETLPSMGWPGFPPPLFNNFANGAENILTLPCPLIDRPQSPVDNLWPQDGMNRVPAFPVVSNCFSARPKHFIAIGRDHEADPQGTHGTYSKPLRSSPNPSCTLVLDFIPSRFRSAVWLATWASNAGKLPPVQVDIDVQRGRGLVEFPDVVAAHKAFNSKQLKGKGKHAIRAWWYRCSIPEIPATATPEHVSDSYLEEMEEGEIVERPINDVSHGQTSSARGQEGRSNTDHTPGQSVDANPVTAIRRDGCPEPNAGPSMVTLPLAPLTIDTSALALDTNGAGDMDMSPSISITPDVPQDVASRPITDGSADLTVNPPHPTDSSIEKSTVLSPNPPLPQLPQPLSTNHVARQASSHIPSEPRSLRSTLAGTGHVKRSLLTRQKELEDTINMRKLELERMQETKSTTPTPPMPHLPHSTPQPPSDESTDDKATMEQNLRWLVLQSKKNKSTSKPLGAFVEPDMPVKSSTPDESATAHSSLTASTLEQLAVSFITESIEAVKQSTNKPNSFDPRKELALKHERLERHIAETKSLMSKLGEASSKEERETILAALRKCTRMMESKKTIVVATCPTAKSKQFRWPTMFEESLEISDEEQG